jgi:hypothetical protein
VTHFLNNKHVHYLLGGKIDATRLFVPYDNLLCNFMNDLSLQLRKCEVASSYPDVITFAFWCRRANIARLKEEYASSHARLGLGTVFHITPSNVPVNFAFSFCFGLLSGNANIVRVPTKAFPQIDIICFAIAKVFENNDYREIKIRTAFIRYKQNEEITRLLSMDCNARIIWGGNETINKVRQLPIPARSVEVVFSDRYSFCIINAILVNSLEQSDLNRLAERFYNDTYLMDQNACSSPHLLVWLGKESLMAKDRFWKTLSEVILEKQYRITHSRAADKYVQFCNNAIEFDNLHAVKVYGSNLYCITLNELPTNIDEYRGSYGYFYEYEAEGLEGLSHIVNNSYQTLTYFGVDREYLLDFVVDNGLSGIDRIVPVGKALDIGVIWDGYDIVKSLSRIIDLQ